MEYIIDCAEILGHSQNCEFWGDAFNWRNVQNYTTRARFKTKTDSAYPLWSGISGLMPIVTGDYFAVYLNGVSVGSGKVTSFSSQGGQDISNKLYDVDFQVLATGDLSYMTGKYYSGLSGMFSFLPYLNSLNETFEYSQEHNKTVNFNRSLDINFERGFVDTLTGASGIKNTILGTLADFGIYHPLQPSQFFSREGIRQESSRLDQINNSYSWSENYQYQSGLPYTWDYSHNLSFDENGVSNITEAGKVLSTRRLASGQKIDYANSGWAVVQTGIFGRVSGFYSSWSGVLNSNCSIGNDPVEKSVSRNKYEGSVSYSYAYNNDFSNYSGAFWSYENEISRDQEGYTEVTEQGNIRAKRSETGQMPFLISFYSGVATGVTGRVINLYNNTSGFFKNPSCSTGYIGSLTETLQEKTFINRPAEISYNFNFSDDPSLFSTGVFRKVKVNYSDNQPVHLTNFFNIINSEELAQGSFQSTLGVLSTEVEIVGDEGVSISGYLSRARAEARVPSGVSFISNEQYSFDPFSRTFGWNRDYTYSKYRGLNEYNI